MKIVLDPSKTFDWLILQRFSNDRHTFLVSLIKLFQGVVTYMSVHDRDHDF